MMAMHDAERQPGAGSGKGSSIDRLLKRYSRWRKRRLENIVELPLSKLALRTAFVSACIVIDGVLLPWIIVALNRSLLSLAMFAVSIVTAVAIEAYVYRRFLSHGDDRGRGQESGIAEE